MHASLTNKVFYANPNKESRKFVKPEVANNPTVFVSPAQMATMKPPKALTNDIRRLVTRVFYQLQVRLVMGSDGCPGKKLM